MKVKLHPDALDELDRAIEYYEIEAGLETSIRLRTVIEGASKLIGGNPKLFPVVEKDVRRCLIRSFPYALLYSIEENFVLILSVMHTSREPDYWRYRLD